MSISSWNINIVWEAPANIENIDTRWPNSSIINGKMEFAIEMERTFYSTREEFYVLFGHFSAGKFNPYPSDWG